MFIKVISKDAVLVENHFGSIANCEAALSYLQAHYSTACYGVNILGDYQKTFELLICS